MPGHLSTESRSPRPKRSFADFDESSHSSPRLDTMTQRLRIEYEEVEQAAKTVELDPSSLLSGTTKRLRIESEEAEQEAKFLQTVPQQPKPLPIPHKHPYALLLEDLVDFLPSKGYCSESVDSLVTQWLASTVASESYRQRHCRSDTLLCYSNSEIIPRRLTKSAPNMEGRRDADGFLLPSIPASLSSRLYRGDAEDAQTDTQSAVSGASPGSGRKKSLVEDPSYRYMNLAENNIYIRRPYDEFPEDIARLVNHLRMDRDSPGPLSDHLKKDNDLHDLEMGTGESDVEQYFRYHVFPSTGLSENLKRSFRFPMARYTIPDVGSKLKISNPVPDILYGYNRGAFPQQQTQLRSLGNEMVANTQDLIYPFFVIEFKADGPGGSGSMWVATNQCLGGSVSCVNLAERLNRRLRHCKSDKVQLINSAAFSIAMNGTEARLYISWKHNELDYYMQKVRSFLLQEPDQFIEFHKYVQNIIDWGKDTRLNEIRNSLDSLLEESRQTASQLAKSRPPPSDDSASIKPTNSKKVKESSSSIGDGNP